MSGSLLLAVATFWATGLFGADVRPINDLPNPYRTVRDWAHPPNGAPWAAVTAVEPSPRNAALLEAAIEANGFTGVSVVRRAVDH